MWRGERMGSLIAAVCGLLFVLINAFGLPSTPALLARVLAVAAFIAVDFLVVRRRRDATAARRPSRTQVEIYVIVAITTVVAIVAGGYALNASGRLELAAVWGVLCTGAHFLVFARVYEEPPFGRLGLVLVALAVVGGAVTVLAPSIVAASVAAVLAGLTLLAWPLTLNLSPKHRGRPR